MPAAFKIFLKWGPVKRLSSVFHGVSQTNDSMGKLHLPEVAIFCCKGKTDISGSLLNGVTIKVNEMEPMQMQQRFNFPE